MENIAQINFSDWTKLDIRVAQIKQAQNIEGADKLYKLTIDAGKELGKKTICAGLKEHYEEKDLKDKRIIYLSNLAPRKMRGVLSEGMLLAASNSKHDKVILISPDADIAIILTIKNVVNPINLIFVSFVI